MNEFIYLYIKMLAAELLFYFSTRTLNNQYKQVHVNEEVG